MTLERRYLPSLSLRMDEGSDEGQSVLTGHAPPWNSLSGTLWTDWRSELPVRERFLPGSFTEFLAGDDVDVKCLFNHSRRHVLGRTPTTLELSEDDIGLYFRCVVAQTSAGKDLAISIDRGDIRGASFAFGLYDPEADQRWIWPRDAGGTDGMIIREISRAFLDDVSPVTDPAYAESSIDLAKRSLDQGRPAGLRAQSRRRSLDLAKASADF